METQGDPSKTSASGSIFKGSNVLVGQIYDIRVVVCGPDGKALDHGGHTVFASLTSKNVSKQSLNVHDNGDGSYFLEVCPKDPGNNTLEVKLNNKHIIDSPFIFPVTELKVEKKTRPLAHWFYQDVKTKEKKFFPYSDSHNEMIEEHFLKFHGGSLNLNEYRLDLSAKIEYNTHEKKLLSWGPGPQFESRPIIRGTWFWKGDDGQYQPYDEESAGELENSFQSGKFLSGNVYLKDGKKSRHVAYSPSGEYTQFRDAKDAKQGGRTVQRGYNGKVVEV